MIVEISSNNVTQLTIHENCGVEEFYLFADKLSKILSIEFEEKVDGFDSLFWSFTYNGNKLIAHYNIYPGISIYHAKCNEATPEENSILFVIKDILAQAHAA